MAGALNMNSQNITNVGQLNSRSVATWISEHDANTAKVSASGSIDTHSDVTITTATDNQLLIYSTGQRRNTNSPFLRLDGTTSMAGALNMGNQSITNVNLVDGIDVSGLDTSVVKLTGDQTIGGNKTFTLGLTANDKITIAQNKPLIIGRTTKGVSVPNGLELYGTGANISGHIYKYLQLRMPTILFFSN